MIRLINEGVFPGAVLLACKKAEILHFKAYGMSVLIPEQRPMTSHTIFDLASLTKPIATTSSFMALYERGKLDLDDEIREYMSEFHREDKKRITLWNLLTHTSGLPSWLPLYRKCKSEEALKMVSETELVCRVGAKVIYSDLSFIVLRYIIERVSKMSFETYVEKSLLNPLGMRDTMFNPPAKLKHRITTTEYCKWRKRIIWGEVHNENAYFLGGVSGHAGLFSTAYDLYLFSKHDVELWFTGTSLFIIRLREVAVILLTNGVHPSRDNMKILKARPSIHDRVISLIE